MPEALPIFLLHQSVASATPLILAGLGELPAQRAGVINVGIEGTMLVGAISAFAAAVYSGSAAAAIPAAILAGMVFGAIFAVVCVWFRADQIVAGTAINLLAAGVSTTAWTYVQTQMKTTPAPALFDQLPLPGIFSQYALTYMVVALALGIFALMRFSRLGLVVRALGDAPDACDAAGISVRAWRTGLLLFAGAVSGLAGAFLSTMRGHTFKLNMTGGQGFLVLALVIFGRWHIGWFAVGTLAFGVLDSLQSYLAAAPEATQAIPHQLFTMVPYAATLVALAFLSRARTKNAAPLMLGRPWPD